MLSPSCTVEGSVKKYLRLSVRIGSAHLTRSRGSASATRRSARSPTATPMQLARSRVQDEAARHSELRSAPYPRTATPARSCSPPRRAPTSVRGPPTSSTSSRAAPRRSWLSCAARHCHAYCVCMPMHVMHSWDVAVMPLLCTFALAVAGLRCLLMSCSLRVHAHLRTHGSRHAWHIHAHSRCDGWAALSAYVMLAACACPPPHTRIVPCMAYPCAFAL